MEKQVIEIVISEDSIKRVDIGNSEVNYKYYCETLDDLIDAVTNYIKNECSELFK